MTTETAQPDYRSLAENVRAWSKELGFQQLGITDTLLETAETRLLGWLDHGFHGEMDYMQKHGSKRSRPTELVAGTLRVLSVRMDYFPPDSKAIQNVLDSPHTAFISRYALGRDYHKVMRKRLQQLIDKITAEVGDFGYRVFVDSAPVLEKPLAEKAGLGWIGKHTNLINQHAGSWFFLGEIYTDLPLPVDTPSNASHCGSCRACIEICPTQAIVEPYQLDARRCISYLTIELKGAIPIEFRSQIGNRIYGCDDCQLVCPWNRFTTPTRENDFHARHDLDAPDLVDLFLWDEQTFLASTEGSAIRRIGYIRWLRNIAVALGNAPHTGTIIEALRSRLGLDAMLDEHIEWALHRHNATQISKNTPG
ncbi:MAG: tRNA epoxyqueuosine(34) reductase QueG [Gammaproteobacteria bacterium]